MTQSSPSRRAQPNILAEGALAGMSLEWALSGDAVSAWHTLAQIELADIVIGVGQPLVLAVGADCPGLSAFPGFSDKAQMPSTQHALWALVTASTPGEAFVKAEKLDQSLKSSFRLIESTPLFRYRDGHDLTGFKDGTGNPHDEEAIAAAIVESGPLAAGTFALVQRFVHFRARFARLDQSARDDVIGRRELTDEEFDEAPESAHVKRTDQEGFDQPADILRRSMPWGDLKKQGLQFIAFMCDLNRAERMLRRMVGLEDGVMDALLNFTTAETGAYYYCPPQIDGKLQLPSIR